MLFWRRKRREEPDPELYLVVGLGNPGPRFSNTRHNIGFMVVDTLAKREGLSFSKSKQQAETARGTVAGIPVLLALPLTYMNESGRAVSLLTQYYHIPLDHLLVIADDIDLPFGTLRLRPSGSSGGQRGVQSIIQSLGNDAFARLRIGVGRPPGDAVQYVLQPFAPSETRVLPNLLGKAADAVIAALSEGIRPAMNEFNRDWLPTLTS